MPTASTATQPSAALIDQLTKSLAEHAPFSMMAPNHLKYVVTHAQARYFKPDEMLIGPDSGAASAVFIIRRGSVTGVHGLADVVGNAFEYEAGDVFPISAALSARAVSAHYRATSDTFVWELPIACVNTLAQSCPVFADFVNGRVLHFLQVSREALRQSYSARSMVEQSLERPLREVMRAQPLVCAPETPLAQALAQMHERRVGSMLVVGEAQTLIGILTRYDILGKITLPQVALTQTISTVMTQPVHALTDDDTAQDAALLMSRHGIRHVPVTRHGALVGIVSERDLFALQRLSIKQLSSDIRAARDVDALSICARDIRDLAKDLLAQGVQARQLTALVSHLNDVLTQQLVGLVASAHGLSVHDFCWIALGSEGRGEQTIATDQDNALILPTQATDEDLAKAMAMAKDVNASLDACGFPLCEGGIMAGEAMCCMRLDQWKARFEEWIHFGSPEHLLNASIFFDFRSLCGRSNLADELRSHVTPLAKGNRKFLNQLALNGLSTEIPLNWLGAIDTKQHHGLATLDLKLQATALVVTAARVFALALGIEDTSTAQRLLAYGRLAHVPQREYEAWVTGFEFIQTLRLRVQLELGSAHALQASPMDVAHPKLAVDSDQPNRISVDALNDVDRRMLKESLKVSRSIQQRLAMDHAR